MSNHFTYDYIIAGSGCAGLSLAVQLKQSGISFHKVLIIDQEIKNKNDRTWCFWTNQPINWFDEIVYKRWDKFKFKSNHIDMELHLKPYQYLLVKGLDFYTYCLNELQDDTRFEFVTDEISQIYTHDNLGIVKTKSATFQAPYVFNSALRVHDIKKNHINYVQHFKGFVIETEKECFDEDCPTFMDFSVEQYNDCRFVYVIPYSKTKALIEYTGFSRAVLSDEEYDKELNNYINTVLKLENYNILQVEKGLIPMAESEFVNPFGNHVINIGTAGGYSKPSTGYTFYFIQERTKKIIENLKQGSKPDSSSQQSNRHRYYDKILLDVMDKKKILPKTIFEILFQKNKVSELLSFLNEESSITQDLKIMNSVPKLKFIPSAFKKMFS
jgi:lycopene beta-cyclase